MPRWTSTYPRLRSGGILLLISSGENRDNEAGGPEVGRFIHSILRVAIVYGVRKQNDLAHPRCSLRPGAIARESWVHGGGCTDSGAGYWCEHWDFYSRRRSGAGTAALPRAGSPVYGVGKQSTVSARLEFIPKLSGLATQRSVISADDS